MMAIAGLTALSAWSAPDLAIESVRALRAPAIMTLDTPFVVNVAVKNRGLEAASVAAAYESQVGGAVVPGPAVTIRPGQSANLRITLRATAGNTSNGGTIFSTRVFLTDPARRGRLFTDVFWHDSNPANHLKTVSFAVRRAAPGGTGNPATPDARLRQQRDAEQRRRDERAASGLPDLVVEYVRIDYLRLDGLSQPGPGRVRVRVANRGTTRAAASMLRVLIESELSTGSARQHCGRIDLPVRALAAGESIELTPDIRGRSTSPAQGSWLWWRAGEGVSIPKRDGGRLHITPQGGGVITAIADLRNEITESHETNNSAVARPLRPWVPVYHRDQR